MQTDNAVVEQLRFLDAQRFEIRAIRPKPHSVLSRVFDRDQIDEVPDAIKRIPEGYNVYVTINPIDRKPTKAWKRGATTKDDQVVAIRTLPIDIDPVHKPASKEQNYDARHLSLRIQKSLEAVGFRRPMISDTGNGVSMLFRVLGVTATDIKKAIRLISEKYSTDEVKIDKSVSNPSRVMRLTGTVNQKGGRIAKAIMPGCMTPTSTDDFKKFVGQTIESDTPPPKPLGLSRKQVVEVLKAIHTLDPTWIDDRDNWRNIAGALKYEGAQTDKYFNLFDKFAAKSGKYEGVEDSRHLWDSLNRTEGQVATMATVIKKLHDAGQFLSFDDSFEPYEPDDSDDDDLSISGRTLLDAWNFDYKPKLYNLGEDFKEVELGPGRIVVLGGGPGAGKTTLAVQWLLTLFEQDPDIRIAIIEADVSPNILLERSITLAGDIYAQPFKDRLSHVRDPSRRTQRELGPFWDQVRFLREPYTIERAEHFVRKNQFDLVVIDYLQCMGLAKPKESVRENCNQILTSLRRMANQFGTAVLALAAVSRGLKGEYKGLKLSSFRESGDIEYRADQAIALEQSQDHHLLKILKDRHGGAQGTDISLHRSKSLRFERFTDEFDELGPEDA